MSSPADKKTSKVLLVANRVGTHKGDTGGGSIFRETLHNALKSDADFEVVCLSAGKSDAIFSESIRGVVMLPCFSNMIMAWKMVASSDLVILSGSFSFLNSWVVFASLVCGVSCMDIITMNSVAAVNGSFHGVMRYFSTVLYVLSDFFNSLFSVATYTRSDEFRGELAKRGVSTQGVVFFGAQYAAFEKEDSKEEIAKARRLLCGVDEGGSIEKPVLFYAGRLIKEKRLNLLIESRPANTTLAIVGNGSETDVMKKAHNPAGGVVCIVGECLPQDRLRTLYKAADIHVSASNFETLGNTIHESLLCGCPVVAENAGGYITQVRNGKNGFLVKFEDKLAVEDAVRKVLNGELTSVQPISHEASFNAMSLVRKHAGSPRPAWKRIIGSVVGSPLLCLLWWGSQTYNWGLDGTIAL